MTVSLSHISLLTFRSLPAPARGSCTYFFGEAEASRIAGVRELMTSVHRILNE